MRLLVKTSRRTHKFMGTTTATLATVAARTADRGVFRQAIDHAFNIAGLPVSIASRAGMAAERAAPASTGRLDRPACRRWRNTPPAPPNWA